MKEWNIYLGNDLIDTVFFSDNCDHDYIKDSLINHDGYDSRIELKESINNKVY